MQSVERYNQLLKVTEEGTIQRLNTALEAAFNRLIRRTRIHLRAAYTDPAQRNLAILQTLRQLIPAGVRLETLDTYDRALRTLITEGQRLGLLSAAATTEQAMPTRERLDVTIPIDATISALQQTKTFLARHGEQFATTASQLIAQGVLEGRPTPSMVRDLRDRLSIVRSRAETIVRTESLRAYNTAADRYYSAQGIDTVLYYATSDDRTCPICTSRAGSVFRRGDIRVPLHPRCRCYLAPWSANIAELSPSYARMREQHRAEVRRAVQLPENVLNRAAVFEQTPPLPLSA